MPKPIAWIVKLLLMAGLFIVYWTVNSEGLRVLAPFLGRKLHKVPLPGFSSLENYEWSYRLDVAYVVTVFFFFASWVSCYLAMKFLLLGQVSLPKGVRVNAGMYQGILMTLSALILLADAITFYLGTFARGSWGAGDFSLTALVITAGYCVCLVCLGFWAVRLELGNHHNES